MRLVEFSLLLSVAFSLLVACSSSTASEEPGCREFETIYVPGTTVGEAGSVQLVPTGMRCSRRDDSATPSSSSGAQTPSAEDFSSVAVQVQLTSIEGSNTLNFEVPSDLINPFGTGYHPARDSGVFRARSIPLLLGRRSEDVGPWGEFLGEYVDELVPLSVSAVEADHQAILQQVYDPAFSDDARFSDPDRELYGLRYLEGSGGIVFILTSPVGDPDWFHIRCSGPYPTPADSRLVKTCHYHRTLRNAIHVRGTFRQTELERWPVYVDAFDGVLEDVASQIQE